MEYLSIPFHNNPKDPFFQSFNINSKLFVIDLHAELIFFC